MKKYLLYGLLFALLPLQLFAQNRVIRGVVVDANGEELIGVTVQIKGTTNGTTTNFEGKYTLSASEGDVLKFSYIGFVSKEFTVGQESHLDVILEEDAEELEEVVVVAFQEQKKESVIGSINTVKVSDLKQPTSNLTNTLAGRIAGVISYQRSGEPGQDNSEFFVRGVTSFGYRSNPLILLDGFEISSQDLARIEPDNIASFSIMKDATATALYGARGANGVILVTTKEGKKGKVNVSARIETSISQPTQLNEMVGGVEYMEMYNNALRTRDPNAPLLYSKEKIENTRNNTNPYAYPNVDWFNELFKSQTYNTRANVNATGGGEVATYFISTSYQNETGLLKVDPQNNFNNNINIDRYILRANLDFKITKTTKLSAKFNSQFTQYNGPASSAVDIFNSVMQANPVNFPKYYPKDQDTHYYNHILFGNKGNGDYVNPYANMVNGFKDEFSSNIITQFKIEQDLEGITKGLSARGMASIKNYSTYGSTRSYDPFYYGIQNFDPTSGKIDLYQITEGTEYLKTPETWTGANSRVYFELATIYNRTFGDRHDVGGLLVYNQTERLNTTPGNNVYASLPARNMGLSGRFTYGFDSRYFIEANFGYNGSERFSQNNRFGFFPSMGLGWTVSNEEFWGDLKSTITQLKFRGTYGLVGNDAIASDYDRFLYLSDVNLSNGDRGYTWGQDFNNYYPGYSINRYPNPDVAWEVAKKLNVGVELSFFDKLNIQADVFEEERTGIYMKNDYVPDNAGWASDVWSNIGIAKSRGLDASADYQHYITPELWITTRANFTYATNEVVQNGEPDYPHDYMRKVGHPIQQQWGLIAERLFIDDEDVRNSPVQTYGNDYGPGDIKYVDINGDGKIDDNDKAPIGYPTIPEIIYGFGSSIGYKGFDFSFFFQGSARSSFYINANDISPFVNERNALKIIADNHWSESNPNPNAFWPRLSTETVENNTQASTWWLRDGSFLRLKSVEIGYSLPEKLLQKIHLKDLRVYGNGNNLYTFSEFDLWDPEMGGNGLGYPPQRVFNIGINATF